MPFPLRRAFQIVAPVLAVSVGGVVLGGLVKLAFGIPNDVAARAGGIIAVAALVVSFAVVLFRIYWNRRAN
jgi:hypothetical protein